MKHYVYIYEHEGKPVYVGIGTEDGGKYDRARDLRNHPSVKDLEKDLRIRIVVEGISRKGARLIEAVLVRELHPITELRNGQLMDVMDVPHLTDTYVDSKKRRIHRGPNPERLKAKAAKQRTTKRYQDYQKDYKKNVVSSLYNSLTTRISRLRKKVREGTATPHDERELVQAVEARAEEKRRCDEQKRTSKT